MVVGWSQKRILPFISPQDLPLYSHNLFLVEYLNSGLYSNSRASSTIFIKSILFTSWRYGGKAKMGSGGGISAAQWLQVWICLQVWLEAELLPHYPCIFSSMPPSFLPVVPEHSCGAVSRLVCFFIGVTCCYGLDCVTPCCVTPQLLSPHNSHFNNYVEVNNHVEFNCVTPQLLSPQQLCHSTIVVTSTIILKS